MTVFQFGVRVAAPPRDEPAGWERVAHERVPREPPVLAPLARGRCHDAVVEGGPARHRALYYFDREAPSLAAAVVTAVVDLEHSGLACLAVVPDDDLVTVGVMGPRLGLSRHRLGGLLRDGPAPVHTCGGTQVFRWSDVVAWLATWPGPEVRPSAAAAEPVLAALNLALRLRRLVRADPVVAGAVRDLLAAC
jgi:hypothetical protein